jgi:hypothetical protein
VGAGKLIRVDGSATWRGLGTKKKGPSRGPFSFQLIRY